MKKEKVTFNEFCYKCCDGLYNPRFTEEEQCTGYLELKKMVINKIKPASLKEIERWEKYPTSEELFQTPNVKYLRFLHPLLRPLIIEHWGEILKMEIYGE